MNSTAKSLLLGAAALCLAAAGHAQTAPAGKTATLGEPRSDGKLLSREELRACLAQQKELGLRKPKLEAERAGLERERTELQQIDESLKTDRAAIEKLTETAANLGKRRKELSQQLADYNERVQKFQNSGSSGPTADRQRRSLENEKATLDKDTAALEAQTASVGPDSERMAKAYDARAGVRDKAAADWNSRSAALARSFQSYETDLETWKADCSGRRYREDDEKAIEAGK
jgi:predicted  nucleic acid-binding Zn-ribbon protein